MKFSSNHRATLERIDMQQFCVLLDAKLKPIVDEVWFLRECHNKHEHSEVLEEIFEVVLDERELAWWREQLEKRTETSVSGISNDSLRFVTIVAHCFLLRSFSPSLNSLPSRSKPWSLTLTLLPALPSRLFSCLDHGVPTVIAWLS